MRLTSLASLCALAQAHLLQMQLDALHSFYAATAGETAWIEKTNWDMRAEEGSPMGDLAKGERQINAECSTQSPEQQTTDYFDEGWPFTVPAVTDQNRTRCYKRDPCRHDPVLRDNAKWYGVGCIDPCYPATDGDNCDFGRVTYLKLDHNNLVGYIPESFFAALTNLTVLDLSHNRLSGTISARVESARVLERLALSHNALSGTLPPELSGVGTRLFLEPSISADAAERGLTHLDVSHNNISGIVPSQLGATLRGLKLLDVSNNPHFGAAHADLAWRRSQGLPTQLGGLEALEALRLDESALVGSLPAQFGSLTKLRGLFARGHGMPDPNAGNQLSGVLPTQLGALRKLQTLRAPHNALSGTVPSELRQMHMLTHFDAQENPAISGTLPEVFNGIRNVRHWDTYGTRISGALPQSLVNTTVLRYLYLPIEQAVFIANSRCKLRVPGVGNYDSARDPATLQPERNKYNWYMLAADYFKLRDPFAYPADGGVPYHCVDGTEEGCDGRTQCEPGVNFSCPGLDDAGIVARGHLGLFKTRWAGVMFCKEKHEAPMTFLRLCELAGDC